MSVPDTCGECQHVEGCTSATEGVCRLLSDEHSENDKFLATVFFGERHPECPIVKTANTYFDLFNSLERVSSHHHSDEFCEEQSFIIIEQNK